MNPIDRRTKNTNRIFSTSQFKSPTMTQMDQHQTHIVSAQQQSTQQQQQHQHQQQQQQQHIITKHLNNASAIVQKVIPRNILVSGRIQSKMEVSILQSHKRSQMTSNFPNAFFLYNCLLSLPLSLVLGCYHKKTKKTSADHHYADDNTNCSTSGKSNGECYPNSEAQRNCYQQNEQHKCEQFEKYKSKPATND